MREGARECRGDCFDSEAHDQSALRVVMRHEGNDGAYGCLTFLLFPEGWVVSWAVEGQRWTGKIKING